MCLEAKKEKAKNDWFICTLNGSKKVRLRSLLEAEINKEPANVLKGFELPRKVHG